MHVSRNETTTSETKILPGTKTTTTSPTGFCQDMNLAYLGGVKLVGICDTGLPRIWAQNVGIDTGQTQNFPKICRDWDQGYSGIIRGPVVSKFGLFFEECGDVFLCPCALFRNKGIKVFLDQIWTPPLRPHIRYSNSDTPLYTTT
jgi:hypothetical protein